MMTPSFLSPHSFHRRDSVRGSLWGVGGFPGKKGVSRDLRWKGAWGGGLPVTMGFRFRLLLRRSILRRRHDSAIRRRRRRRQPPSDKINIIIFILYQQFFHYRISLPPVSITSKNSGLCGLAE